MKYWGTQDLEGELALLEKAKTVLGPHGFFIDVSLEQGHGHPLVCSQSLRLGRQGSGCWRPNLVGLAVGSAVSLRTHEPTFRGWGPSEICVHIQDVRSMGEGGEVLGA